MKRTKNESTHKMSDTEEVTTEQSNSSKPNQSETPSSPKTDPSSDAANVTESATVTEEVLTDAACTELEKSQAALEELQAKYNQLNDTYLRTMAEFDNYRKRTLKEKADLIKSGGETVLINLLPVIDDMERGIQAASNSADISAVKDGLSLIFNKFNAFLKQNGVNPIETTDEPFNTDHHEAIATIPAPEEGLKGKIIDCVQKGYFLNDKVIRFAKVVVGE